jgi:hypothetical protein
MLVRVTRIVAVVLLASFALAHAACSESEASTVSTRGGDGDGDGNGDGDGDGDGADAEAGSTADDILDCDGDETNPDDISAPAEDFEVDDYRFELASQMRRTVEGIVVSTDAAGSGAPSVIRRVILIATGSYLDDGCLIDQNGASFSWEGVACEAESGTLFNVLTLEPEELEGISRSARNGMKLRLTGYEIERFNDFSPGGGYFTDGGDNGTSGQVSLWLTQICETR